MNKRLAYFQNLLSDLQQQCAKVIPELTRHDPESGELLLARFATVMARITATGDRDDYLGEGQDLITLLISHYPQLTPAIHRDLMWFFGGDCLHFLSEEELGHYQELEERYYQLARETGDAEYRDLRAMEFGLH
jgi:hypothetical protein